MEKDYKSVDCMQKASANDAVGKPEHEIRAEIVSIEIVGEDTPCEDTPRKNTPRKNSKKYETWGTITFLSLVALIICFVCSAVYGLTYNIALATGVSALVFFVSVGKMISIIAFEPTDTFDEDEIIHYFFNHQNDRTPPQND